MVYLDPFSCILLGTYKDDCFNHLTYIYDLIKKKFKFSYAKLADLKVPFALLANKNIAPLLSITAKLPDASEPVYI